MSVAVQPSGGSALPNAVAMRRVHVRGAAAVAIGVLAGAAVFAFTAAWPARAELPNDDPASRLASWVISLPVERSHAVAAGERPSLVLTSENRGQVLFGRYCDSCHYAGNENLGPSLRSAQFKRTYTSSEKIADFVRKGGYDMPAYTRSFLSDPDLAAIAEYARALPEGRR